MRSLGAGLLFLTGIGVAAYGYYPATSDRESQLATATLIVTPAGRVAEQVATTSAASQTLVSTDRTPTIATWTPTVTVAQLDTAKPSQRHMTSSKPGDSETRRDLSRSLQKELRRVGCYEGEITGAWTGSTKRAMSAFIDRVNAALPVDEPDYILLTLLQGHSERACGNSCPSGQSVTSDGRCLPNAVVAQATRKAQRAEQKLAEARVKADADARRIADIQIAYKTRGATAVEPPGAAANPVAPDAKVLPWLQRPTTPVTPPVVSQPVVTTAQTEPLPGRMSIGGPTTVDPALGQSSVATIAQRPAMNTSALQNNVASVAVIDPSAVNVTPGAAIDGVALDAPVTTVAKSNRTKLGSRAQRAPPPYAVNRARKTYYASNVYSKARKNQPRPGTASYNLMLGLGGIY